MSNNAMRALGVGGVCWLMATAAAVLPIGGCGAGGGAGAGSAAAAGGGAGAGAVKGSYSFWPVAPDMPRIQFVRSYRGSNDLTPRQSSGLESLVFGKEGAAEAEITKPYGVAMRAGKIYVCDMRGSTLVVLDLAKKQTRLVGSSGANRLNHPVAVTVAADGQIYVADNERGAIVAYDANERYLQTMGVPKFKPVSLAVSGEKVYACDMASQSVMIFDRASGKLLGQFGKVGDGDGEFRVPLGIAADKKGNVYVADMMRCRVQKFTGEGQFIAGVGTQGDYAGSFARPKHIAVDDDGILYVVDAAFQNVQMFDEQFRLLMSFGAVGNFPGSMDLPAGIAVCEDSTELFKDMLHPGFEAKRVVLVTNQFGNNRVAVYAMGQPAKGYTGADLSKSAAAVSAGVGIEEESLKIQQALPENQAPATKATNTPATPAPVAPR